MSTIINKFEFVGNIELENLNCGCCSILLNEGEIQHEIQSFQCEIFMILFENFQLTSNVLCHSCNEQLINIHHFRQEVREKLKISELHLNIKTELEDSCDIRADFDFVKTDSPEREYEEPLYENISKIIPKESVSNIVLNDLFPPQKKRIRRPPHETNDGRRKGGITYNCCLCKRFTSDNKKDYADHILETHALNYQKGSRSSIEDLRSKMVESRPLPEPKHSVQCDYCGSIYNTRKNLLAHIKIHIAARNQVSCVECKKSFSDLRIMVRHRNHQHGNGINFWCYCGNEFDNARDLNRCRYAHGRNKVPEKSENICDECKPPKIFNSSRQVLNHKNKHHGRGTRFWCVRCGQMYHSREEQVACVKLHYTDVLKDIMIKCPQCDKELLHNSLKIHMKSVHSSVREIVCHECGKAFCAVARLTVHMRQVHNNGFKPWICDLCGRSWAQKKSLRDHMLKIHSSNRKSYQCPICLKVCQDALDRHMTLVHPNGHDNGVRVNTETNMFHCPNCIQTFDKMKAYELHVNENLCENYGDLVVDHSQNTQKKICVFTKGEFKCKICNSVQRTIARLRRHQHYVHSGIQYCPVCNKKMSCKRAVIGHLRKVHKTNYTTVLANSQREST